LFDNSFNKTKEHRQGVDKATANININNNNRTGQHQQRTSAEFDDERNHTYPATSNQYSAIQHERSTNERRTA